MLLCSIVVGCSSGTAAPVDFLRFDGITYVRSGTTYNRTVPAQLVDRASAVGEVESRRQQPGGMPRKDEPEDGYAASLEPGTPVYAVKGYDPSFRLAARRQKEWALYEAVANPSATTGAGLLDIGGKVSYLEIEEAYRQAGEESKVAIRDPNTVDSVVDATLNAPLEPLPEGLPKYLLVFHLKDGTRSVFRYRPSSGDLYVVRDYSSAGVVIPERFRESIERRLRE